MPSYPILNGKYTLERTLGSGYSCKVKLGRDQDGNYYAIKIFKSHQHVVEANVEIEALGALKHPNIVAMHAAEEGTIERKGKESKKVYYLVLELVCGGEIFDFVSLGGRLSEESARFYFRQLISALDYMHGKGVAHRDLKPENLLIDENFNLKVTDFGFAGPMAGRDGSGYLKTNLGTQPYKAPELHMEKKYTGEANDLFASAIILFILVSQRPPFGIADPRNDDLYKVLAAGKTDVFWQVHAKGNAGDDIYSDDFKDLFEQMTQFNPKKRITMEQLIQHPWIQGPVTPQEELIEDFKRRQEVVDKEALKEQDEKKQRRRMKKAAKETHRSNALEGPENSKDTDLEREAWAQLEVKPYGAHQPKKTQFFTTASPLDIFEELVTYVKDQSTTLKISDSFMKVSFGVPCKPDAHEETKQEEMTCIVEVLEVDPESKYCVSISYRDENKCDVYTKQVKSHYKAISKALREYNDITFQD